MEFHATIFEANCVLQVRNHFECNQFSRRRSRSRSQSQAKIAYTPEYLNWVENIKSNLLGMCAAESELFLRILETIVRFPFCHWWVYFSQVQRKHGAHFCMCATEFSISLPLSKLIICYFSRENYQNEFAHKFLHVEHHTMNALSSKFVNLHSMYSGRINVCFGAKAIFHVAI